MSNQREPEIRSAERVEHLSIFLGSSGALNYTPLFPSILRRLAAAPRRLVTF